MRLAEALLSYCESKEEAKGIIKDVTNNQVKKCKHILDFPNENILALIKAHIPEEIFSMMADQDIDTYIIKIIKGLKKK